MQKSIKRTLYFDCFSGVSGDMVCASLIDLGADRKTIRNTIESLMPGEISISIKRVMKCGISSLSFSVKPRKGIKKFRTIKDIEKIYERSSLSSETASKCIEIFRTIAKAEAKIHRKKIDEVHFHEIGAVDTLVDITTAVVGIRLLKADKVISSPVNLGGGTVKISHGLYPVPAPATAEILKGMPVYSSGNYGELTTPTGAAILKILCSAFDSVPEGKIKAVGYGAGCKDLENRANVLRTLLIEEEKEELKPDRKEQVYIVETNIDDQEPQSFEYLMDKLFEKGALDVWFSSITMKKSRPAIKVSVLCKKERLNTISELLLRETTTFGVRYFEAGRMALKREMIKIKTKYGEISAKVGIMDKKVIKISPEYESVKKLAEKKGIPFYKVFKEAEFAARNKKF
ncbi:MAG: nickel pincer cofactor biosynthesis protein LarC [Candidatus Schekmanbacteria bacterium]|nr:MAG: nickel pincer cofactor biosynthesis protein LarC [Candidatus Schekmanbacteria bacterium]